MEINGKPVTHEAVASWLKDKHITLWADWLVTDPKRMDLAVDWFMHEISDFASA